MNRYAVFAGQIYYPNGGAHDLRTFHGEYWEARYEADRLIVESDEDWAHVFDMELGVIVYEGGDYVMNGGSEKARGYG